MKKVNKHIFKSFWKTDDEEWMKQRRKDWKNIQLQLDRMCDNDDFDFNTMKKKDYKYLKNYFLTGRDTSGTPLGKMQHCLLPYSPVNGGSYILMQFWLCPDHSAETLKYIKNNTYLRRDETHKSNNSLFEDSCFVYRRSIFCYSGNYKWVEEEGTTTINGPIFGDLEVQMMALFSFSTESIKELESSNSFYHKRTGFEGALLGFLEILNQIERRNCWL